MSLVLNLYQVAHQMKKEHQERKSVTSSSLSCPLSGHDLYACLKTAFEIFKAALFVVEGLTHPGGTSLYCQAPSCIHSVKFERRPVFALLQSHPEDSGSSGEAVTHCGLQMLHECNLSCNLSCSYIHSQSCLG